MELQTFNYHTHTYRCGHAQGSAEEMIQAAIQAGFKTIGISEHMGYADWDDPKERPNFADLDDYLQEMYTLKEKYRDQIKVRIGFECEYFSDVKEYLAQMRKKCDYFICGQHSIDRQDHYVHFIENTGDDQIDLMADQICEAIETGMFGYIAHPDYFLNTGVDLSPRKEQAIKKIAECAKKHDVVLEVNLKGTRFGKRDYEQCLDSYLYPNTRVFEIVASVGTQVCFGYDAHHPSMLLNREIEKIVAEKFKDIPLNFVEDLKM